MGCTAVSSRLRTSAANNLESLRPPGAPKGEGPIIVHRPMLKISKDLRKDSAQLVASHMNTLLIILIIGVEVLIRTSKSEFLLNSDHVSFNFYC